MAVIEINRNPSRRELLVFGLLLLIFSGIVGGLIWYKFESPGIAQKVWIVGGVLVALFYAIPPIRRPLYLGWIYAAFPIGFVLSHVILALVYYLVFTPIGLLIRLFVYDPMSRKIDPQAESYWVEHDPHRDPARYFRQF